MIETINLYFEHVLEYLPRMLESLGETGIMLFFAILAAILLGILLEHYFSLQVLGILWNIIYLTA